MLKSPLPAPARRVAGVAAVTCLSLAGACAAWAAQPGQPALPPTLAAAPTTVGADAREPADHSLTRDQARQLAGPNDEILCKPEADRSLKACRIVHGKTWAQVATPADIAREYPAAARKAGYTARVLLECRPNVTTRRLDGCAALGVWPINGKAAPESFNDDFEQAAVKVAARYEYSASPPDGLRASPMLMTIDFSAKPILAGGPAANTMPTHAPAAAVPSVIAAPNWVRRPDGADVARVYPTTAKAQGLAGRTTMECRIDMKGLLRHCAVMNESPAGAGFGEAALQLAERFQMAATSRDGVATAGNKIRIPIRWVPPGMEAAPGPMVTAPVWLEKPTLEQLVSVMPPGDPEGRALMGCRVQGDGRLAACEIVSEAPQNVGLGAAALQLAPHFRMAAKSPDGARTAGSQVRIPVRFAVPLSEPRPTPGIRHPGLAKADVRWVSIGAPDQWPPR